MAKKKVYKLKKWPKVLVIILILLGIAFYFGYQGYQKYLYRQSYEYKFMEIGYTKEEANLFEKKLKDNELEKLLTYEHNEFIYPFIATKYFMFKNLDLYLSQVITQEEDFFKYHGTEGYDYDSIVATVNVSQNKNIYEDVKPTDFNKGYAIIANKHHELGLDYEPDDLVNIDIKYYYGDKKQIRKEVYDAFIDMWNAAHEENIYLIIDSAYRTSKYQSEVYKFYENSKGTSYADVIAARPGFSEHQTGLALDIYSKECFNAEKFKDSKTYEWLINNAYKYGFVLRYPDKKQDITGYKYESWHYRYLGKELAKKVYDEGITFDEYYAFYLED